MRLRCIFWEVPRIHDQPEGDRGQSRKNQSHTQHGDTEDAKGHPEPYRTRHRLNTLHIQVRTVRHRIMWTPECDQAFQDLKNYMSKAPLLSKPLPGEVLLLYLSVSNTAVSSVLIRKPEKVELPIFYVSKALQSAELRYPPLEQLALALVVSARRLRPYFQAHEITVLTNQPLRQVLQKPETSGRLVKWAIELGEFDIQFRPRPAEKGQVVAEFISELTPPALSEESPPNAVSTAPERMDTGRLDPSVPIWVLHVDGSANQQGCGAGLVLTTPDGSKVEYALRFSFRTSNNEAEYEALLAGLRLAKSMSARQISIHNNGRLRSQRCLYVSLPIGSSPTLAKMSPIYAFLTNGTLPTDKSQARKLRYRSVRYTVINDVLYKRGYTTPYLKCLTKEQGDYILREVHSGSSGRGISGRPYTKMQTCWSRSAINANGSFCTRLKINLFFASPAHPQWNGQVEALNKIVKKLLKRQHDKANGAWLEKLPEALWDIRTSYRTATGETPFSMAFGSEAVVPVKIGEPSYRTETFTPKENEEALALSLDLIEEHRAQANLRNEAYKQRVSRYYDSRVRSRSFRIGDWVMRKVYLATKNPTEGTLGPSWEGPYEIIGIQ
ncbi:unnamed protein product [Prunus brigantina]